jgi:DNA-binding response OmpR family regulator
VSVQPIPRPRSLADDWRLPGCDGRCWPRSHNPEAHAQYGRLLEREAVRQRVVRTGPLVIDLETQLVTVNSVEILLSGHEWDILSYLAARPGRWCASYDILIERWGPGYDGATRLIAVTYCRLRKKLGPAAARLIETHPEWRLPRRRLTIEEPSP